MEYMNFNGSKGQILMRVLYFLILLAGIIGSTVASTSDIQVIDHEIDPSVLIPGDLAEVTVTIKNTGNSSVTLDEAKLYGIIDQIEVVRNRHGSLGDIGSGNFRNFTFTIKAVGEEGVFYPKFVLSYWTSGADLRYIIPVEVDETDITAAIIEKPDSFPPDKEETVKIRIGNPRENELNGIVIEPEGDGVYFSPETSFIGKIQKNNYSDVSFDIRAIDDSEIIFNIYYRNGINQHSFQLPFNIDAGTGKKHAELVINNVEIKNSGSYQTITGEVYNTGLEDAVSVVMTTGGEVKAVDPYRFDVVGLLEPDDSSSFTLTFLTENAESVEIIGLFKDTDGNEYVSSMDVELISSAALTGSSKEEIPSYIMLVIAVIAIIVGVVIYRSWTND